MATHAVALYFIVIHRVHHPPNGGIVAGATGIRGGNMCIMLGRSQHTIMTIDTISHDLVMIRPDTRHPTDRRMTGITVIGSRWVGTGFFINMTAFAGAYHLGMIHGLRRREPGGRMTGITLVGTVDMRDGRRCLAYCHHIIVTIDAHANDFPVIHSCHGFPGRWRMAGIAVLRAGNMPRRLAHRQHRIVTTGTVCGQFIVINRNNRSPGKSGMAGFTPVTADQVIHRLPGCRHSMTGSTIVYDARMIEHWPQGACHSRTVDNHLGFG